MAEITDASGNVVGYEPDTIKDWEQAAAAEARMRRDLFDKLARIRRYCKGMPAGGRPAEHAADIISIIDEP